MPVGSITLPIVGKAVDRVVAGQTIPVRRLWVDLSFPCRRGPIVRRRCLLDTGAPICVVPEFH